MPGWLALLTDRGRIYVLHETRGEIARPLTVLSPAPFGHACESQSQMLALLAGISLRVRQALPEHELYGLITLFQVTELSAV